MLEGSWSLLRHFTGVGQGGAGATQHNLKETLGLGSLDSETLVESPSLWNTIP